MGRGMRGSKPQTVLRVRSGVGIRGLGGWGHRRDGWEGAGEGAAGQGRERNQAADSAAGEVEFGI